MSQDPTKVVIITGAGAGIGKATAKVFVRAGYRVVLAGRQLDKLEQAIVDIGGNTENTLAQRCDVGDPDSVQQLFDATQRQFGRLDVLFNNAGVSAPAVPIETLTYAQWQSVVDANLTGAFLCAQAAIKMMKSQNPQGGRIINNGSISAHAPRPMSAPYTATKHAITGLTKSIALDGRAYRIACSQIDIGNAATEMTERMAAGILQADGSTKIEPRMDVNHVADSVLRIADMPLESNVLFMTIMATGMPYVGRG